MGLKVMTVLGTRPEIIKLSRVIAELDARTDHVLVHTGQNYDYEVNEVFFQDLEVRKPDYFLDAAGETAAETIAKVIAESDKVFAEEKPDAALFYGDTNSALSAIPAKRRRIPIFHMEAGNRSFDDRVPEEINRRIIDHISDINMPLTEHGRRYLLREGIRPETVIKTGSTMAEVLDYYRPGIERSKVLDELGLRDREYFIVSAHREENVDYEANLSDLLDTLDALVDEYGMDVIVSTHPRTRARLDALGRTTDNKKVRFMKALGFFDYVKLQLHAFCIVSDSGTITEEASLLDLPAVTVREAHERPEGMDEGTLVMSGFKKERALQSVRMVTSQYAERKSPNERLMRVVGDYEAGAVSIKVARIIMSYVDYVNRTVWYR